MKKFVMTMSLLSLLGLSACQHMGMKSGCCADKKMACASEKNCGDCKGPKEGEKESGGCPDCKK